MSSRPDGKKVLSIVVSPEIYQRFRSAAVEMDMKYGQFMTHLIGAWEAQRYGLRKKSMEELQEMAGKLYDAGSFDQASEVQDEISRRCKEQQDSGEYGP